LSKTPENEYDTYAHWAKYIRTGDFSTEKISLRDIDQIMKYLVEEVSCKRNMLPSAKRLVEILGRMIELLSFEGGMDDADRMVYDWQNTNKDVVTANILFWCMGQIITSDGISRLRFIAKKVIFLKKRRSSPKNILIL